MTRLTSRIYFETHGSGSTALIFVHGWMGNGEWWNAQREFFKDKYTVVQMDLPGHGRSAPSEKGYSSEVYAEAISRVAKEITAAEIILVGHSMSGAYVLEAAPTVSNLKALIIVDTLKNLDQLFTIEDAEKMMFSLYRKDYKNAVENFLPQFLFSQETPVAVKDRLQREFLSRDAELSIALLAPLYKMDVRSCALRITVPVRSINSDFGETDLVANRKYLKDYDNAVIKGTGHYPMLEKPEEFNQILERSLSELS